VGAAMIVIFVHGWNVKNTDTYGQLPRRLQTEAAQRGIELKTGSVLLSEYVSFDDEVTLDDIARAFEEAVQQVVLPRLAPGERFACITHSTGGPVVRTWLDLFHGPGVTRDCRMSHLVMLAPANHGSALAQLGKSKNFADEVSLRRG
jgi:triacylglycerol esterase/lipase EstA (alpha/beta hydrolase family)